jgi:hypothetical protein
MLCVASSLVYRETPTVPCLLDLNAAQTPCLVLTGGGLIDQCPEGRLPHTPLPYSGTLRAPMTQPLERSLPPPTTTSQASLETLCQAWDRTDEMRQVALPQAFPGLRETIAFADEAPSPVRNELRKCGFKTIGM